MAETLVSNASPLIVLAKAGYLDLLERLCDSLLIPDAVIDEIMAGPADDPARVKIASGWGRKVRPQQTPASVVAWGLGAGESSVLALALECSPCTAVLDDGAARAAARTLGVATIGTLGLLMRAKVRGHITSAADAILAVRNAGLFLDERVVEAALKQIGEAWRH